MGQRAGGDGLPHNTRGHPFDLLFGRFCGPVPMLAALLGTFAAAAPHRDGDGDG